MNRADGFRASDAPEQARAAGNAQPHGVPVWRAVLAAFCASLIGIGLARFAYTPLLPAIVAAHWFDASVAAYLGAANLAGYLAGALLGRPLAARVTARTALRAMMGVATLAFFACAYPVSFGWFFVWRALAGLAGGALMVLAAPAVLPRLPAARRGLAGGLIFMGVGVGVAASGTLVPWLLQGGLRTAWCGIGLLSLLATALAWHGWPHELGAAAESGAAAPEAARPSYTATERAPVALRALFAEYALNAAGWVPHMIFLVDFVARGLGQGLRIGAEYWVVFGIGATFGPLAAGALADKTGFGPALRAVFVLEIVAVLIPALGLGGPWLMVSSVVVGAFVTGTVPLVLGRIHELLPDRPARQNRAWRTATVGFALCQALAAYALSFVFARSGGDYRLLFAIGAAAMTLALALDLAVWHVGRAPSRR